MLNEKCPCVLLVERAEEIVHHLSGHAISRPSSFGLSTLARPSAQLTTRRASVSWPETLGSVRLLGEFYWPC